MSLAACGRRTGAIYLWGYCVEMLVKSAYFTAIGVSETTLITWQNYLSPAINRGRNYFTIAWPATGRGHNVRAWSELLVLERISLGIPYPQSLSLEVQRQSTRIEQLWSETLRYHSNIAYMHEVRQVRTAAEWFLVNENVL
jgi:hypothetical protein